MVQDLRKRNLFVTAMNSEASVIRYHALFREFLRKKLVSQTKPAVLQRLYTVAAAHFNTDGDVVRSIDLLLISGQFDRAVKQMELCGELLIAGGQAHTLIRWIETLPLEYGNRPWFLFFRALTCRFTDPRTALTFFELAHKGFQSDRVVHHRTSGLMLSLCGIIEASFYSTGDFKRMARAASTAQTLLRRSTRELPGARARLLLAVGMAWFFIGRLKHGSEALGQALALFRNQGDHFFQITSAIYLVPCALYQGDFRLARDAVRKGFEASASLKDETGSLAALSLVAAMTALFEGNFEEAQDCIDKCRDLADIHSLESMMFLSLDVGGWLKIAQGDYRGAELLLKECRQKGEESHNTFFSASAAHLLAIAYLFQGKLDRAKIESDYALAVQSKSGSKLFHAIYLIASGAIHMKLENIRRAEKELLAAITLLQQIRAGQQEANAHLVLARLYQKIEKPDKALKHLRQGFSIGRDRGFRYYALFDAAELAELARTAVSQGVCVDYCSDLLTKGAGGKAGPLLKAYCLGGFKLYRGSDLIPDAQWKSKRARTLLKMLVAHDGQKLPREQAMELLWPDSKPASVRTTFNSLLYRVRKVLEPDMGPGRDVFCSQEGDILALNSERIWTDVGEFLRFLETARSLKVRGKSEKALKEYEEAIALYQGDFLPEELYNDWAAPMRDRLRIQYLKALEEAANIAEASGCWDRALVFHEKLFSSDLCNETVCCRLMTQYHSEGRRNDAIRAYERCELALRNEMDLEPGDETRKVYQGIISK
jgi:LuxR family transcriptional regulator, maltose regulon positive regulatory protein